jgi:hypothetical protein
MRIVSMAGKTEYRRPWRLRVRSGAERPGSCPGRETIRIDQEIEPGQFCGEPFDRQPSDPLWTRIVGTGDAISNALRGD